MSQLINEWDKCIDSYHMHISIYICYERQPSVSRSQPGVGRFVLSQKEPRSEIIFHNIKLFYVIESVKTKHKISYKFGSMRQKNIFMNMTKIQQWQ